MSTAVPHGAQSDLGACACQRRGSRARQHRMRVTQPRTRARALSTSYERRAAPERRDRVWRAGMQRQAGNHDQRSCQTRSRGPGRRAPATHKGLDAAARVRGCTTLVRRHYLSIPAASARVQMRIDQTFHARRECAHPCEGGIQHTKRTTCGPRRHAHHGSPQMRLPVMHAMACKLAQHCHANSVSLSALARCARAEATRVCALYASAELSCTAVVSETAEAYTLSHLCSSSQQLYV